jgi:Tfp pilus assembly protein PilF
MDSENAMYRYRRGDKVADAALSWLGNRSRRRPFFCWVHFFDPHRPYYVPASIASAGVKQAYDFEVSFMDSQIARIIDRLRGDKLLDDTVIIALGDHGEGLGEHGEDEHGLLLYDSVMRVPLIISFPKRLPAGTETDTLVSIVDLFPTVMEIFGWRHKGRLSGKSFAAALSGGAVQGRDFYSETEFPLTEYGWSPLRSVTTEGWKYIAAPREELYDLPADPPEKKDLATEQPEKVRGMKARLAALEGAMVKKESSQVAMDEASRKVLESLGYLSGGGKKKGETASLRDPKDAVWMRTEFINAIDELNRGKTSEGEAMLRKLIKESPESYAFRYKLAKTMYDQGRFTEALPEFEEMAKMDPESFGSHYNLGKALNKLGQYARAAEELRAALTFEAKNTDGLNNLGIALLGAGKTQEAIDTFRQSISIKPDQCDPHNNLGNALLKLGKTDEALEEFRKAVKVDPNFFEGRFNVGLILLNQGDFAGAAAEFQHAVRLRPGFAEAHRYLGIALTKSGRAAEGLREFAAAEQLKGGGRPAHQ